MNKLLKNLSETVYLSLSHGELRGEENLEEKFRALVQSLLLPEIPSSSRMLDHNNIMELREDTITVSLTREEVLANAPETKAGCFIVPKTI